MYEFCRRHWEVSNDVIHCILTVYQVYTGVSFFFFCDTFSSLLNFTVDGAVYCVFVTFQPKITVFCKTLFVRQTAF